MLSDLDIAQRATLKPIREIAAGLSVDEDELEPYGKYKAKIDPRRDASAGRTAPTASTST